MGAPFFRRYTPTEGLSSLTIHALTGDSQGRIYAGTGNGVDRLDPESGKVEHYTTSDGLPSGVIQAAYSDRRGNLWFATRHGIARLVPGTLQSPRPPPAVRIMTVKVRSIERPVSAAGETSLSGLLLRPDEDQVEFGFTAPRFRASSELLYQYRLDGAPSAEWSHFSSARSVNFANLPPGSYRFVVQAASPGGLRVASPASVAFRILPPFWSTWWFQLGAVTFLLGIAYGSFRYRMQLVLEREQLRMRIATDLHDDIGSSLSRIAIWSEVALQQADRSGNRVPQPLAQIGGLAREMIDSMSDIVWAVNPKFDRFTDLASRMRRYVSDLGVGTNLPISFTIHREDRHASIGPVPRREVFLVFKEALNNVLRHAGCTECSASLSVDARWLTLRVRDNGRGFDAEIRGSGQGLDGMARRAERLGGTLLVESAPGRGTKIELRVPRSVHDRTAWKGPHLGRWSLPGVFRLLWGIGDSRRDR